MWCFSFFVDVADHVFSQPVFETVLSYLQDSQTIPVHQGGSSYLTGVGVGAFTCRTGEGDCWRPPATLATSDGGVGDLEVGLGGTLGGVLWAKC